MRHSESREPQEDPNSGVSDQVAFAEQEAAADADAIVACADASEDAANSDVNSTNPHRSRSLLERCSLIRWLSRKLRRRFLSGPNRVCGSQRAAGSGGDRPDDADADQLVMLLPWMIPRTRPRPLRELSRSSGLSPHQLRRLYAKFKQECPNGLMQRESFQEICGFFFPLGEASLYAGLLFDSFLASAGSGCISSDQRPPDRLCFEQIVAVMSRLSRGSLADKLRWLFALYDADKDGRISRRDLLLVVTGVYSLCGTTCHPPVLPSVTAVEVADRLFTRMDADQDGAISWEDFEAFLTDKLRPLPSTGSTGGGECSGDNDEMVCTNQHLSFLLDMDPLSHI